MFKHLPNPAPKTMFRLLLKSAPIVVVLSLTACGTKGPLYIPEQRYPDGVPKEQDLPKNNDTKEMEKGVENDAAKKHALVTNIHAASRAS